MSKRLKSISLVLLTALMACCFIAFAACTAPGGNVSDPTSEQESLSLTDESQTGTETDTSTESETAPTASGLFGGTETAVALTDNYTLGEDDLTDGDLVKVDRALSLDLAGYTLDLNGYTLEFASQAQNALVEFKNGEIVNGKLIVSVPNGDIKFDGATLAANTTYEFEAASETITFINANVTGKGSIKSNTNVNVSFSAISDITLEGNGTLNAGVGANLGAITVGENGAGAKVNVTEKAKVSTVEIKAAADVKVDGQVSEVTVAEEAKQGETAAKVTLSVTATVDKVELKAAASVSVAGTVSSLAVAESAKNDEKAVQLDVEATANVDKVEVKSVAKVNVSGTVANVTIAETAKSETASVEITVAEDAEVTKIDVKAPAAVEVQGEVTDVVLDESAEGASVTISESALVDKVVVKAENTTIASENYTSVYVADTVENVTADDYEQVGEEQIRELTAHTHLYVFKSRIDATCTEEGVIIKECEEDGETTREIIPALGHDWKYLYTTDENGELVRERYCSRCGERETLSSYDEKSIILTGLEKAFALVEDGTYIIEVDGEFGGLTDFSINVEKAEIKVKVTDGYPKGTIAVKFTFTSARENMDMTVNAELYGKIDGNILVFTVNETEVETLHSGEVYSEYDFEAQATMTAEFAVKAILQSTMGVNLDALTAYDGSLDFVLDALNMTELLTEPEYEDLDFGFADFLKLAVFYDKTEDENGYVTYTLSQEKINEFKDKAIYEIIDDIFGENFYENIIAYIEALPEKKVSDVVNDALDLALELELTASDIEEFLILVSDTATPIFAEYEMGDINIYEMITQIYTAYKDKTVAEAFADFYAATNNNSQYAVPEGEDGNYETSAATQSPDLNALIANALQMVDAYTSKTISDYLVMLPDEAKQILQMVDYIAGECLETSFTLSSDNELVGYTFDFNMPAGMFGEGSQEYVTISVVKGIGDEYPTVEFDFDLGMVAAKYETTEEGKVLTASVMGNEANVTVGEDGTITVDALVNGNQVTLSYAKTEDGITVTASVMGVQGVLTLYKEGDDKYCLDITVEQMGINFNASAEVLKNDGNTCGLKLSGNSTVTMPAGDGITTEMHPLTFNVTVRKSDEDLNSEIFDGINAFDYTHLEFDVSKDGKRVALQRLENEKGIYYLLTSEQLYMGSNYVNERKITATFGEYNGAPDVIIAANKDCNDWYEISIEYMNYTETYSNRYGKYTVVDGKPHFIKLNEDYTETREGRFGSVNVYYNTVTKEVSLESQHEYEKTYEFVGEEGVCEEGVKIISTCTKCGKKKYSNTTWHDYVTLSQTTYNTLCGEVVAVERKCGACGKTETYYNERDYHKYRTYSTDILTENQSAAKYAEQYNDTKNRLLKEAYNGNDLELFVSVFYGIDGVKFNYSEDSGIDFENDETNKAAIDRIMTEYFGFDGNAVTIEDIAELGYDTEGFYYGYVTRSVCSTCGLTRLSYTWYTHTDEGCLAHTISKLVYGGFNGYASFEPFDTDYLYSEREEHHYSNNNTEYDSETNPEAVQNLKGRLTSYLNSDVDFTVERVSVSSYSCAGCGESSYTDYEYNLNNGHANLRLSANSYVELNFEIDSASCATSALNRYGFADTIPGFREYFATVGENARYSYILRDGVANEEIHLDNENATFYLMIYDAYNYQYQITYRDKCEYYGVYCNDGKINEVYGEAHSWDYEYHCDENCAEDGCYEVRVCSVCGATDEKGELYYQHNGYWGTWFELYELSEYSEKYAELSKYNGRAWVELCDACNTALTLDITLSDDWTLEDDLYIKADNVKICLNGHTIDLNGHNLIVYAYDSGNVYIYDEYKDYGEDDEVVYSIVNSGETGYLLAYTYYGDIEFANLMIAENAEVISSDNDNRHTIARMLEGAGYDVPEYLVIADDDWKDDDWKDDDWKDDDWKDDDYPEEGDPNGGF